MIPRLHMPQIIHQQILYEIANLGQVNDLLRLDAAPRDVKWSSRDGFYVENLLLVDCDTLEDVFSVLNEGGKNRKVKNIQLHLIWKCTGYVCFMRLHGRQKKFLLHCKKLWKTTFVQVGSHELNKDSSRSHCIMTLHVDSLCDITGDGHPIVRYTSTITSLRLQTLNVWKHLLHDQIRSP